MGISISLQRVETYRLPVITHTKSKGRGTAHMGQGMKPGFTHGMEQERDRRRKVLLASVLMESAFCANDVARLLSDHKNGKPVSKDAAKKFLDAMVEDRLISRVARQAGRCGAGARYQWVTASG